MTNMLEQLASRLRRAYPAAKIGLDAPKRPDGNWWLDFALGPNRAEIEWRPGHGLGVSANSPAAYGERSDEVYATADEAFKRLKGLIAGGEGTEPPPEFFLRTLRESRQLTQIQLARLLKVKQASISKMENRADMHLSTMRNIVNRLGAQLEIRAVFPDGAVNIVRFGPLGKGPATKGKKRIAPHR